jgi:DNA-directed RNA polymerase subunit M/transcription elongation factor TFIIS
MAAATTSSTIPTIDFRKNVVSLLKQKSDLDDLHARDMEIGIYNWTIIESGKKRIARNWANPRFQRLYVEKARSVTANVDKESYLKNIKLVERIKEHEFCPHDVAFMKPENIHPDMWKSAVGAMMKKYENAYENKAVAMTDMFKCGKCKKRECTFYEMQTRSGDESTTIFIRCVNCGNSWRQG